MPPHFTGLPREIRDAILELCLVVEGPINPYPTYYEDPNPFEKANRKPDVALLKVNKKINAEAAETLYGGNLWKLTWRLEDYPRILEATMGADFFDIVDQASPNKIWEIHRADIRHITLDLDIRRYITIAQHRVAVRKNARARRWECARQECALRLDP